MSHFGDYMDGVPVKISEKYKRPPAIELPYSVIECPSRAQQFVENIKYCSTFENNVLAKIKELRKAKETKKNERVYRLQLLEEAKQKKLDLIAAAEAEEKLKQLSVSDVSYPSTEEISEISPDDRGKHYNINTTQEVTPNADVSQTEIVQNVNYYPACNSTVESQPNILQPIQVTANYHPTNLLDDPDPLQDLKMNKQARIPLYNPAHSKHFDNMSFSDFENDTSSPFDNVELKTINDMELLAQVLQDQHPSTACLPPQSQFYPNQTYQPLPNCSSQAQMENIAYVPTGYMEQPIQGPGIVYAPNPYPMTNGYYIPTETICDNSMPPENVNMYMPTYQYYVPTGHYQAIDSNYYTGQTVPVDSNEIAIQVPSEQSYIPQPYYFQCPQVPVEYPQNNDSVVLNKNVEKNSSEAPASSYMSPPSKSRSVPDIFKELDEELKSAKLRANERSCNASPAPKVSEASGNTAKKTKRKLERLVPNFYDKLPASSKSVCQKIHAMGFPLERVARVCTEVGENDKRIIEILLLYGELLDLGFPENRVSRALIANDFNRDKALDELIK